ncbi:hypothetical protein E2C01_019074 [Portunus trituberculatus]|uniref:Uncharacterized protein n=1 Tax=Portunus trituberculatus TaxID=210409 RepID=A0A5B7DWQ0_PORTR|nr:hypothetical protein [Portunus trituberculatus]
MTLLLLPLLLLPRPASCLLPSFSPTSESGNEPQDIQIWRKIIIAALREMTFMLFVQTMPLTNSALYRCMCLSYQQFSLKPKCYAGKPTCVRHRARCCRLRKTMFPAYNTQRRRYIEIIFDVISEGERPVLGEHALLKKKYQDRSTTGPRRWRQLSINKTLQHFFEAPGGVARIKNSSTFRRPEFFTFGWSAVHLVVNMQ